MIGFMLLGACTCGRRSCHVFAWKNFCRASSAGFVSGVMPARMGGAGGGVAGVPLAGGPGAVAPGTSTSPVAGAVGVPGFGEGCGAAESVDAEPDPTPVAVGAGDAFALGGAAFEDGGVFATAGAPFAE